jgi:hypothetical protein
MKWIFYTLAFMAALVLSGCSVTIIHPPSAASFMEKNEDKLVSNAVGFVTLGDRVNYRSGDVYIAEGVKEVEHSNEWHEDWAYRSIEWPVGAQVSFQKSKGYFKYGFGFDFASPFVQAGLVSDYFGIMGWSNLCLWQFEKIEYAYFQWGGGVSVIEQLPIGDNLRIGLTQHLSRNGREASMVVRGAVVIGYGRSAPVFYDEIGGGGYVSFVPGEKTRVGLEFRYGRDLSYKRVDRVSGQKSTLHRYTIMVDFQGW